MNVEIKSDGSVGGTQLLLDSKKIEGVQNFTFSASVDGGIKLDISLIVFKKNQNELTERIVYMPNTSTGIIDNTEKY